MDKPIKTPPYTVYLGKQPKAKKRYDRLKELAQKHAGGSRSKLVQMIADGELDVLPKEPQLPHATPIDHTRWRQPHFTVFLAYVNTLA